MSRLLYGMLLGVLLSVPAIGQTISYAPTEFGPNAHPVPRLRGGELPSSTVIESYLHQTLGGQDNTQSLYLDTEIPLISQAVSFRVWGCVQEHYTTSAELAKGRGAPADNLAGWEGGDYYLQTRFRILRERGNYRPEVVLNTTLKTASAKQVSTRRYFDTAGYFFHLEVGKSIFLHPKWFIDQIRLVLSGGFMCWEAGASLQNDAPMYGVQLIFRGAKWTFDSEVGGYSGWMGQSTRFGGKYGDRPIVIRGNAQYSLGGLFFVLGYEHGLRDFPYQQISAGIGWNIPWDLPAFIRGL